jgi:glycosyltransferase involved in cell wall biosynthesis
MRLCYLADPASTHTQRWVRHFADAGYEVHLIHWGPPPARPPSWPGVIHHDLIVPPTPAVPGVRWAAHFVGRARVLRALLREIRPDLLHAHYISGPGWLAAQAGFHPLVMTAWGSDILLGLHGGPVRERLTLRYALRRADLLTADARLVLDTARPYLAPRTQAVLIRIGADTEAFRPGTGNLWRTRLGLDTDPVILSVRQCHPMYNIDTIVRALPAVRAQIPWAHLLIKLVNQAADDPYVANLRALIVELKLTDAVTFVPYVGYDELPDLYRTAQVVVSVPSSDGMPVSVLEAMACGTPVVVSDLPALRELAGDGADLPLVPARDAGALGQTLIRLLADPDERTNIAAQNLETVRRVGDFAAEMGRMEALYRDLVKGGVT